jgi:hypothetical protein
MKTPREILLERHQAAAPKLDLVRHAVVGKLNNEATKEQSSQNIFISWLLGCSKNIWCELILPSRRIWAGLAAVWILIFAANFSLRDHSEKAMAKASPSPEMMAAYRQQQELLAELIGQNEPAVAEPQKIYVPRPSSRRSVEVVTV